MSGRPKGEFVLSESEREDLQALTMRRTTAQALALRARIVLASADGMDNKTVATKQRVTQQTVSKWRARFVIHRLDGLLDAPRPGAPRTIDDARVDAVIEKTLESVPDGATHWSTRTMAREMKLAQTAVTRIWRAFGLQPYRQETFKLPSDPMFVDKVRDIVGLYLDPPLKAMVLCVDGKSQIQALDRTQPMLPLAPGSLGDAPTMTCATARPHCSQRWTSLLVKSSARYVGAIAAANACAFCAPSKPVCRLTWICIW
jgi:transposase